MRLYSLFRTIPPSCGPNFGVKQSRRVSCAALILALSVGAAPPQSCPAGSTFAVWARSRSTGSQSREPWACTDSAGRVFFVEAPPFQLPEPVFNVRTYGATGDGRADDLRSIMAAYAAATAKSVPLATLYFPPGKWRTSDAIVLDHPIRILIDSGSLVTAGPYAFVFKRGSDGSFIRGRNGATLLARDRPKSTGALLYIDSSSRISISELDIDGNGDRASVRSEHAHGILLKSSSDLLLKNLYIHGNQGDAIDIYGVGVDRVRVENVYVRDLGRAGLDLTHLSGAGLSVNNFACSVGNRVSTVSEGECVHSEPAGSEVSTSDWHFSNLFLDGAGIGVASNSVGGMVKTVSISDFRIRVGNANGISIAGAQDVTISDGDILGDSSAGASTFVAIKVSEIKPVARTGRVQVSRVHIRNFRVPKKAGVIYLTSSANDGNQAFGHVTLGPGITIEQALGGSAIYFATEWPYVSIVGDTIRHVADRCIVFNAGAVHFDVLNNVCTDYGSAGVEVVARNRPVSDGRILNNELMPNVPKGKIGINLPGDPLVARVLVNNNKTEGNEWPLVVGKKSKSTVKQPQ